MWSIMHALFLVKVCQQKSMYLYFYAAWWAGTELIIEQKEHCLSVMKKTSKADTSIGQWWLFHVKPLDNISLLYKTILK